MSMVRPTHGSKMLLNFEKVYHLNINKNHLFSTLVTVLLDNPICQYCVHFNYTTKI